MIEPLLGRRRRPSSARSTRREKPAFFAGAAATLFPSDWPEPFGLVMIESLAAGTPVIALRRGSVPEVIEDGVTGFICDDVDEMVSAVGRLDEIDPDECRRQAARFSAEAMCRGVRARCTSALGRGPLRAPEHESGRRPPSARSAAQHAPRVGSWVGQPPSLERYVHLSSSVELWCGPHPSGVRTASRNEVHFRMGAGRSGQKEAMPTRKWATPTPRWRTDDHHHPGSYGAAADRRDERRRVWTSPRRSSATRRANS